MDHFSHDAGDADTRGASGRRAARDSMFLLAELDLGAEQPQVVVRVRNISEGGMMAEGGPALEVGQELTVTLRGVGSVRGQVAWIEAGRVGIAFDEPVDPRRTRKPVTGARGIARRSGRLRPVP